MAQQKMAGDSYPWLVTTFGLGLVWGIIVTSFPSQQELTGIDPPRVAAAPVPPPVPEPTLDLTVPSSPPLPSQDELVVQRGGGAMRGSQTNLPAEAVVDARSHQVVKLKCEAEIQQLCPAPSDSPGHRQCIEERMSQLALPCQHLIRERFVKWREERTRIIAACQNDVRRYCPSITPGSGTVMQCLQEHAQAVSDRCHQTLPKGTLYFKH